MKMPVTLLTLLSLGTNLYTASASLPWRERTSMDRWTPNKLALLKTLQEIADFMGDHSKDDYREASYKLNENPRGISTFTISLKRNAREEAQTTTFNFPSLQQATACSYRDKALQVDRDPNIVKENLKKILANIFDDKSIIDAPTDYPQTPVALIILLKCCPGALFPCDLTEEMYLSMLKVAKEDLAQFRSKQAARG